MVIFEDGTAALPYSDEMFGDHWPSNSPDLNPLDYSIWDELALQVKWDRVTSKQMLRNELK